MMEYDRAFDVEVLVEGDAWMMVADLFLRPALRSSNGRQRRSCPSISTRSTAQTAARSTR